MHIERIHKMIECLTEKALAELERGIEHIDTCEFGEVVDMIKDLNEAEYRAVIVKSMKEADEEEKEYDKELLRALKEEYGEEGGRRYYDNYRYKRTGRYAPKGKGSYVGRRGYEEPPYYHMMPYEMGVSDYKEHSPEYWRDVDRANGKLYFTEPSKMSGSSMRDSREGRSGMSRRTYMETKEMHKDNTAESKQAKMKELEKYMSELSSDITDMIGDASQEERNLLKQKLQLLTQKIS